MFTLSSTTLSTNLLRYLAKLSVAEADETSVVNEVLDEVAEQRELRARQVWPLTQFFFYFVKNK